MRTMLQIQCLRLGQYNMLTLQPRFRSQKAADQSEPERSLPGNTKSAAQSNRALQLELIPAKTFPGRCVSMLNTQSENRTRLLMQVVFLERAHHIENA